MTPYQASLSLIPVRNSATSTAFLNPANAQRYRDTIAKLKPPKPSKMTAGKRFFPRFEPGMATADYIAQFQGLNNGDPYYGKHQRPLTFVHADRAAPMLDPSIPEVEHEVLP
jgi:hypothetical protein